jgi:hypothetical protein
MVDFQAVKAHFDSQNLSYCSFPKSEKSIKVVIHHLPINTPAEDIAEGLVDLGFEYKSQNALTQCYNCQKFGHIWANCKQPPRCLWCGGGHLHKDCPEEGNTASTPTCCNCQLAEGKTAHPANYQGCRHAKE